MMFSLELFSGAGGMAKGLELSGFDHRAFVEYNIDACKTLRENYNPSIVHEIDVRDFEFASFTDVDLIAGGPPCQPFSLGGKHLGNSDARDMFPYAINAIEKLTPKAFIFENVKGLLRNSFSEYLEYIIQRLKYPSFHSNKRNGWKDHLLSLRNICHHSYDDLHYNVSYKLVNAANYGVPQRRERVIIVGIRHDIDSPWQFPTETHSEERLYWDKYVSGEYWDRHRIGENQRPTFDSNKLRAAEKLRSDWGLFSPPGKAWVTVRDAIEGLPDPRSNHGITDHLFRPGARTYPGHTGSEIDLPSKTIKAGGHGVPGGENMIRFHDGTVRYFTVLEAKRIQSFPDDYVIHGSWGEAMRQIGNAVPVKLANIIGDSIYNLLGSKDFGFDTK